MSRWVCGGDRALVVVWFVMWVAWFTQAHFVGAEERVDALHGAVSEGLAFWDLASTETFKRREASGSLGFGADTSAFDATQRCDATARTGRIFGIGLSFDAALSVAIMAFCALDIGFAGGGGEMVRATAKAATIALANGMIDFCIVLSGISCEGIGGCTARCLGILWRRATACLGGA